MRIALVTDSYLPVLGGNKGPLVPGSKRSDDAELQVLVHDLQAYLDGDNSVALVSLTSAGGR